MTKEEKYGKNDLDHLQLCPRCVDAVPVRVEMDYTNRKVRWFCRKCETLKHIEGALIKEWEMADYVIDPRMLNVRKIHNCDAETA
jgi:hypothetical protein